MIIAILNENGIGLSQKMSNTDHNKFHNEREITLIHIDKLISTVTAHQLLSSFSTSSLKIHRDSRMSNNPSDNCFQPIFSKSME
ncbi:hypothetical protein SAMN05421825_3147 [Epilithonimonas hungarica]|uniref:Uncharacterized protein n=1 Tax=Epilithonimonas hungarica TaxID=454006 RepID=A0A1G7TKS7_9FLAO|nr:hypothetical protein SAMN05421825_3147 [Epilithonimonas hungarica]